MSLLKDSRELILHKSYYRSQNESLTESNHLSVFKTTTSSASLKWEITLQRIQQLHQETSFMEFLKFDSDLQTILFQ